MFCYYIISVFSEWGGGGVGGQFSWSEACGQLNRNNNLVSVSVVPTCDIMFDFVFYSYHSLDNL